MRACPYSACLGGYILDVDRRAHEEMEESRRLSIEELAQLRQTHYEAALDRREHFPVMSVSSFIYCFCGLIANAFYRPTGIPWVILLW